jgi:hypothetical protein
MKLKAKAIATGLLTFLPGLNYLRPTGGTGSARYCYSVWLRHLTLARGAGLLAGMPSVVAELGPGDSIGIGLAALLSGVEQYYALDLVRYTELKMNLEVFDALVALFHARTPIPAEAEFPGIFPKLHSYDFPSHLFAPNALDRALAPERVREIRSSIAAPAEPGSRIVYQAPWSDAAVIREHSVDYLYSQAVLEHVDDLAGVYPAMRRWLRPGGAMSHQIDFQSHGKADTWNGHWTYGDLTWKLVAGRRAYLLNRVPRSEHIRLLEESGFTLVQEIATRSPSALRRGALARRFRTLSEDDLTTSGTFVLTLARD